jgi:hypothetical protein
MIYCANPEQMEEKFVVKKDSNGFSLVVYELRRP